jgi:PKD repeat protein
MKYRILIYFILFSIALAIISGCGEDFPILTETLKITNISVSQSILGVGETAVIEAFVSYSGDETLLIYEWKASGGTIGRTGKKVNYIAPSQPGVYTIELVVSDGAISDGEIVEITVTQQTLPSITLDLNSYWPAEVQDDKLAYDVNVKTIATGKVTLHYDITQDQDNFDVFLSIQIGQKTILNAKAIGAEQPSTAKRTVDDIDVSKVITVPGRYLITFYVTPGNRVKNGWLLNEAKLIGVTGTSDPQQ